MPLGRRTSVSVSMHDPRLRLRSSLRAHGIVLGVFAAIASVLTAVLWLHPTLGFAQPGSIIAGADLRSSMAQILWILFAVIAVVSTLVLIVATRWIRRRLVAAILAYVIAFAVLPLAITVLDHYY